MTITTTHAHRNDNVKACNNHKCENNENDHDTILAFVHCGVINNVKELSCQHHLGVLIITSAFEM